MPEPARVSGGLSKEELILGSVKGLLSLSILTLLNQREMYGQEIAAKIGELRGLGRKLSPGTIYPALKSLQKKGLIESRRTGRKVIYRISEGTSGALYVVKSRLREALSSILSGEEGPVRLSL